MTFKKHFQKWMIALILIASINFSNTAKAQKNNLQDSIMAMPADNGEYDKTFTKVEHPATFPNGLDGWRTFLEANLKYPRKAQKHSTQGVVRVQLIVDMNGNVKDVKALNDPGDGLAEEAERVIRLSGKWIPATQNGRRVTYRFAQTITFQLQ